jgi:DNA-binding beta-propeller fold protein YncE
MRLAVGAVGTGLIALSCATGAASLKPQTCTTAVATQTDLPDVRTTETPLLGNPSDVVVSADGRFSFISLSDGRIAVAATTELAPRVSRVLRMPGRPTLNGLALTHDGRYLLAADGASGAIVLDVSRAETQETSAVVGALSAPIHDGGAVMVATSADDALAFVALEKGNAIAVFDLSAAVVSGFKGTSFIGTIPVDTGPVGLALSPDGRWLYVTSELASPSATHGTLSVIDVGIAGTHPAGAVVGTAAAGCGPVRVAVSPDGGVIWVSARESNAILAFSAEALRDDPAHALLATVPVGAAPIGLALVDGGRRVVVADSNRFRVPGSQSALSIVDAESALAGRPAAIGTVRSGDFPRGIAIMQDGRTVMIANFNSKTLQTVDLTRLP